MRLFVLLRLLGCSILLGASELLRPVLTLLAYSRWSVLHL